MMMDIFSSFDPTFFNNLIPLNINSVFILFSIFLTLLLFSSIWMKSSMKSIFLSTLHSYMYNQSSSTFMSSINTSHNFPMTLFIITIFLNLSGLVPYLFSLSSHLIITMCLSFSLWLSLILSSFILSPYQFTASILPGGAPAWLNFFLTLIESISILVRPITLSFRLAANMSAGHIVLALISMYSSFFIFNFSFNLTLLIIFNSFYMLFELMICMIQAYIFCLLITLYSSDHTSI